MAPLSSPGIGSGLDVNSIVTQLMTLERRPLTLLATQQSAFRTKLSAIGQLQSVLSSFQTAANGLTSATTAPAYRTTTGDISVLSATASNAAVAGSYAIGVTQLAQSQKIVASGIASTSAIIGSGTTTTLSIDFGTISDGTLSGGTYSGAGFTTNVAKTPISVTIDSSNNTLAGIRDAINARKGGVNASIVNDGSGTPYRLVLTSTDSGGANSLRIGVTGDATLQSLLGYDPAGTQSLSQLQVAQNALLTVDGIAITSASNTLTDAVQGVTLNLLKANTPSTAQLGIQRDTASLATAINALVTAYNNVNTVITSATGKDATLQADSTALTIQRQLRSALSAVLSTSGLYKSLADISVTLQKDGTLAADTAKLQARLNNNFADVSAVLTSFGASLTTLANNILDTSSGQLANASAGINASIKDNNHQQDTLNQRLTMIESTYRAQFSALDAMMVSMNHTSSFLQQQFYKTPSASGG